MIAEHRDLLLSEVGMRWKKRSPASVVRYMAALSHAYTIAMKEWGWVEDSPIRKVQKPKEPRGRVRFLDDEERQKLLRACKNNDEVFLYPIVVLALSTGARRAEILGLTWGDIDLQRKVAVLHQTKNNERRALPLAGPALQCIKELAEMRRIDTRLLFPDKSGKKPIQLRTPWGKALKEAEIENFKFHDLHHSAASYLAMSGASLAEIAEVLGHIRNRCPRSKNQNGQILPIQDLRHRSRFLQIRNHLRKNPTWKFVDSKNGWYCPFCALPTGILMEEEGPISEPALREMDIHLRHCKILDHQTEKSEEEIRISLSLRDKPEWGFFTFTGRWICPFCIHATTARIDGGKVLFKLFGAIIPLPFSFNVKLWVFCRDRAAADPIV